MALLPGSQLSIHIVTGVNPVSIGKNLKYAEFREIFMFRSGSSVRLLRRRCLRGGSQMKKQFSRTSALLLALLSCLPSLAIEPSAGEPVLKLDVPKMDVLPQRKTLKGGVQHSEAHTAKPHKLSAGAAQGQVDAKLSAGTAKNGIFNKIFKVKVNQTPLNAAVQSGVGIIGVKFILGFGRPPVINRVFPGTPAQQSGLRINDVIVAVDGVPTNGLTKEEVYSMIVGTPETAVTVSILRNQEFLARTMNRMDFNDIPDPMVKRDYLLSM